ncbi:hypothetical protein [Falsirhodobacter deserti]|uniref:hypothetical protein n=1 Tax=Falsirhodobacter deserti TaxID=1365611 RepID=UPI000FE40053|nr:hypothetical protein [Falsirhodobacter deserti]
MIVQALKQVGMAFLAPARAVPATTSFFEVQLISNVAQAIGTVPLSITTDRPFEVARELMRDRDPKAWGVEIRPVRRAH